MVVVPAQATDPISLWESLREAGAVTETELRLPADLSFDNYEALAIMFGRVKRATSWLIGDLILFGEAVYGEKYAQAASMTGLAPSTLANYASVCKHIPPSRRRPGISFSLHQEVAYLSPEDQNRWLDMAEQQDWTKELLRLAIRSETGMDGGEDRTRWAIWPKRALPREEASSVNSCRVRWKLFVLLAVTHGAMGMPECSECSVYIPEKSSAYWTKVEGWERKRAQGGTNHLSLRKSLNVVMCNSCMLKLQHNIDPNQANLFG